MSNLSKKFNRSKFSKYLNSPTGKFMRVMWSMFFVLLAAGLSYNVGVSIYLYIVGIFFIFIFFAGIYDICLISFLLGGPLLGRKIRGDKKIQKETKKYNKKSSVK